MYLLEWEGKYRDDSMIYLLVALDLYPLSMCLCIWVYLKQEEVCLSSTVAG